MLTLKEIMTRDVLVARPDTSIREAIDLLSDRHLSGAPVVDGGKVVGVFSTSDILAFLADVPDTTPSTTFRRRRRRMGPLEDATVDEVMTRKVQSLGPECAVDEAAVMMAEKQIHRVLVMDGDALLGIVTTSDVAKAFAEVRR